MKSASKNMRWLILDNLLILALCCFSSVAVGQTAPAGKSSAQEKDAIKKAAQDFLQKEAQAHSTSDTPGAPVKTGEKGDGAGKAETKPDAAIQPEAPPATMLDEATTQKYLAAMQEYYQYRILGYQHRQRVFDWQLVSTKIIFIVVTILVLVGIYFSWMQFHGSLKRHGRAFTRRKEENEEVIVAAELHTEVEASLSGVKVSSPVLGVIILMISFLFFYLYLVYVYPISELF